MLVLILDRGVLRDCVGVRDLGAGSTLGGALSVNASALSAWQRLCFPSSSTSSSLPHPPRNMVRLILRLNYSSNHSIGRSDGRCAKKARCDQHELMTCAYRNSLSTIYK